MYGLSVQKVYASGLKGTENLEKDSLRVKRVGVSGAWKVACERKDKKIRYDLCGFGPFQLAVWGSAQCTGDGEGTAIGHRRLSA